MATKFYLHNALSGVAGTLPGAGVSVSATTPDVIGDSGANRSMDATIGVSQTSKAITTLAQTGVQGALIARFLSAPLAAQTIASQQVLLRFAISESSTNSDFFGGFSLAIWRPSTGAVVTRFFDLPLNSSEAGTAETDTTAFGGTCGSATVQAGDILVVELWRWPNTQAMATAYTNTAFYDGTTEGSTTSNAAYVVFTNDVALQGAATSLVARRNHTRGLTLRPRKARSA